MSETVIFGVVMAVIGAFGGYVAWRQLRTMTRADRDRAEAAVDLRILTARTEERQTCADKLQARDDRIQDLIADLDRETDRANRAEQRATDLQSFINSYRSTGG